MDRTLATLVITIIASSSMKLPNVSWPIESVNDRIRRTIAAKAIGIGTGSEYPRLYDEIRPWGNLPMNPLGGDRPLNPLGYQRP